MSEDSCNTRRPKRHADRLCKMKPLRLFAGHICMAGQVLVGMKSLPCFIIIAVTDLSVLRTSVQHTSCAPPEARSRAANRWHACCQSKAIPFKLHVVQDAQRGDRQDCLCQSIHAQKAGLSCLRRPKQAEVA